MMRPKWYVVVGLVVLLLTATSDTEAFFGGFGNRIGKGVGRFVKQLRLILEGVPEKDRMASKIVEDVIKNGGKEFVKCLRALQDAPYDTNSRHCAEILKPSEETRFRNLVQAANQGDAEAQRFLDAMLALEKRDRDPLANWRKRFYSPGVAVSKHSHFPTESDVSFDFLFSPPRQLTDPQ